MNKCPKAYKLRNGGYFCFNSAINTNKDEHCNCNDFNNCGWFKWYWDFTKYKRSEK